MIRASSDLRNNFFEDDGLPGQARQRHCNPDGGCLKIEFGRAGEVALSHPSPSWGGWRIVSAANEVTGGGCFSKGIFRALPCATPTRRFAPPSPQGGRDSTTGSHLTPPSPTP